VGVNGELGQLVCLATYGTLWLGGDRSGRPPDLTDNSTFRFVQSAEFDGGRDVAAWYDSLLSRGVRRLWLGQPAVPPVRSRWPYLEPYLEVGFANGGHWFLLITGDGPAEAWHATWSVVEPRPADTRIWAVKYTASAATDAAPRQPDLAAARAALDAALSAAREFARRVELPEWAEQFGEAIETEDDRPPYLPDMMAADFPDDARRLIAKASKAWVFGGMGSWNDLGFDNEAKRAEHADVSRLLFVTLLQACVAAVNCPLPDRSSSG
jgi:hypothetical protein